MLIFLTYIALLSQIPPVDFGDYSTVPNFPSQKAAQYFLSDADAAEIEKHSGELLKTNFKNPLIEIEYGGFHIEDLEKRKEDWLRERKSHVSNIQIDTLLTKRRLSALLVDSSDKQFGVTYVAYILSEAPSSYSLVRVFFPIGVKPENALKSADGLLQHLYDPKKKIKTRFLNPYFPDHNFFAHDTIHSQASVRHYSDDKYSFMNIRQHLKSQNIEGVEKYFDHKARRRLSFKTPQSIEVPSKGKIRYDLLIEYFIYLDWYKKENPNEKGELTRLIVTVLGYKGDVAYFFGECIDDPKFNIATSPQPKEWLQKAISTYGSQRSPEYIKWQKHSR